MIDTVLYHLSLGYAKNITEKNFISKEVEI